jgi:hypothetical protein
MYVIVLNSGNVLAVRRNQKNENGRDRNYST